jgi:hypothetical protein
MIVAPLRRFETRSIPNSLVACPRDFTFYVAGPASSIPDLGTRPPSQACPRPAVKFTLTNAASVFDDLSQPRYDNIWRINVIRVVVSFRFRIAIPCLSARGIWYQVAVR